MVGFCSSVRNRKGKKSDTEDKSSATTVAGGLTGSSSDPKSTNYTVSANMSHSHSNSASTSNVDMSSTHDKKLVHMGLGKKGARGMARLSSSAACVF